MEIKHYKISRPFVKPPEPKGWKQAWYGYYRFAEVTDSFVTQTGGKDREAEVDILLSVIEDINKRGKTEVRLMELGAGWGEWCLALAGVVDFKLIPHNIKSYGYLAVEGVPAYCESIYKHFEKQGLKDWILNAAVSDKIGECRFNLFTGKDTYYCQGMTFGGNFGGSKLKTAVLALYHLLQSKTTVVPMVTVDYLVQRFFGASGVDIIHCDVQGVEEKVIKGAMNSMDKIDYWIVGTHHKDLNYKALELLKPWYDCIVNILPKKEKKMKFSQDGIQLYRRKGL